MDTSSTQGLRVAFIGAFDPYFTTENELLDAMLRNGMSVREYVERDIEQIDALIHRLSSHDDQFDFVLWTSTKQHRDSWGEARQWKLIATAKRAGVPLVAYHLDRWWGLDREDWLDDPYFKIDLVVTADGGHEDMWPTKQIMHRWLPPGVSERWCQPGMYREEFACDVVFVGNWHSYGHLEWKHRHEMIQFLSDTYPRRGGNTGFRCFPKQGHPAIRGLELNDVYWSAKVVVGDSCLVPKVDGSPMTHYCSDRIPETMGRGGVLLHPDVEGVSGVRDWQFPHCSWPLGDWGMLRKEVDALIELPEAKRQRVRDINMECVKANHTYTVRVRQLVDIMREEGLL